MQPEGLPLSLQRRSRMEGVPPIEDRRGGQPQAEGEPKLDFVSGRAAASGGRAQTRLRFWEDSRKWTSPSRVEDVWREYP